MRGWFLIWRGGFFTGRWSRFSATRRWWSTTRGGWARLFCQEFQAMRLELTAVFRKVPEGYIGFVEEIPGANTQGATLEEARANLKEAVHLV